ncbi:MAG: purine-binding chemotaxis protein CheW [Nitrospirae bacterium]|nr:purine-binding chemotaxis protein CheW [Nitrospirota bacterium]
MADEIEVLTFKLTNKEYAVRVERLREILRYQRITHVPRAEPYLIGVTSVRGKILPVIDLKKRLAIKGEDKGRQKIIILSPVKVDDPIGILIDSVKDVIRFSEKDLLTPSQALSKEERNFIEGVIEVKGRLISLLNIDEAINMESVWV